MVEEDCLMVPRGNNLQMVFIFVLKDIGENMAMISSSMQIIMGKRE